MIAFHGNEATKQKYLTRVRMHRAADNLVKGMGWDGGKGCAIGCTLESYRHDQYETELGIPQVLARLEDRIFEALPNAEAMTWPERFLAAIPVGADLSKVWPRFAIWTLRQCMGFTSNEEVHGILDHVAHLYETEVPLGDVRWREARDEGWRIYHAAYAADADAYAAAYAYAYAADAAAYAADAAYAYAADAAAADAADADAYSAAYAAAYAYAYAADAAAADAADAAAREQFWSASASELLRLMVQL